MDKEILINEYLIEVAKLKQKGKELNLTEKEIENVFAECLEELQQLYPQSVLDKLKNFLFISFKLLTYSLVACLFIYFLLCHHQPTLSLVMRNVQGFIYPSLKLLRYIAVPIISKFPSLTGNFIDFTYLLILFLTYLY